MTGKCSAPAKLLLACKLLSRSKKDPREVGRPFKIEFDEKIIIDEILSKRRTQDYLTMCQIIKFAESSFQISLTYG